MYVHQCQMHLFEYFFQGSRVHIQGRNDYNYQVSFDNNTEKERKHGEIPLGVVIILWLQQGNNVTFYFKWPKNYYKLLNTTLKG